MSLIGTRATGPMRAECGRLEVFEDRASGSGRTFELNIAILRAKNRTTQPDPLFFFAGGPGQAATETYPSIAAAFDRINQKRDIVLVDQRGTGGSNPLTCPPVDDDQENAPETAEYLRACLAQLNADPTHYTTAIAIDDLEQVRQALGYGKINLYGVSYGSRAALPTWPTIHRMSEQ
jgi:pimeloyl-ACP methyl ester carboxylesterase